jgi:hypothetical protein
MDEIISYKMCAVKVRNAKLRNYLKLTITSKGQQARKPTNLFEMIRKCPGNEAV